MYTTKGLKLIGKGLFSKCYQLSAKEVLIQTNDHVKECNALFMPYISFIPQIERVDDDLYVMEYYPKVTSLKNELRPKEYELYKELRSLDIGYNVKSYNLMDAWRGQFNTIKNKRIREGLNEALDCYGNYGTDICFEISPRNVAVKNGKLILLDCFFIKSQMLKYRTN